MLNIGAGIQQEPSDRRAGQKSRHRRRAADDEDAPDNSGHNPPASQKAVFPDADRTAPASPGDRARRSNKTPYWTARATNP